MSDVTFAPSFLVFHRQLRRHNDREWFKARKARWEAEVRDPMLQFLTELRAPLARVARFLVVDPRPTGGSLMRIYRDTRFSEDKTPYKVHTGAHVRHRGALPGMQAPGFYLHLEPGASFLGGGLWHPDASTLALIRHAILADPTAFKRAKRGLALSGESLKRSPQGFDPDHPLIDDLRRKDFIMHQAFTDAEVLSPAFLKSVVGGCKKATPFLGFLAAAVGAGW